MRPPRYSAVFMNIIFTAILSRILVPDDYGIVAAVMVSLHFSKDYRIWDSGSVIQQKQLSKADINSIFTQLHFFLGSCWRYCSCYNLVSLPTSIKAMSIS